MQIQDFNFFNIETYASSDKSERLQELFGVPFYREENTNKYSNNKKKSSIQKPSKVRIPYWAWIVVPVLAIVAIGGLVKIITAIVEMIF